MRGAFNVYENIRRSVLMGRYCAAALFVSYMIIRVVAQGLAHMSGGHGVGGSNPPNPICVVSGRLRAMI